MEKRIDREALFTDETSFFRYPEETKAGDEVTFRFRCKRDNVTQIFLLNRAFRTALTRAFSEGSFDYFETKLRMTSEIFYYIFEIRSAEETLYYTRLGVCTAEQLSAGQFSAGQLSEEQLSAGQFSAGQFSEGMFSEGQFSTEQLSTEQLSSEWCSAEQAFRVIPGYHVPAWARGAVMYQIFTDRFCNGDPSNDTLTGEYFYDKEQTERAAWDSPLRPYDVCRFYGGDLEGVRKKLPYLKSLGVEAIYFNPLFLSPSNHGYDVQDYEYIDPHFTGFLKDEGALLPADCEDNTKAERYLSRVLSKENLENANAYFAKFTEEVHQFGMKVILDGVFNHCGSFHHWMDAEGIYAAKTELAPGAAQSPESPWRGFFYEDPKDDGQFVSWWNHLTLPKLNYENSGELREYILKIGRKWVASPYCVDGWRLDVAADIGETPAFNHEFFRAFRDAVREENPEALILAEHYGDPGEWLRGDQWDTVMNYDAFMEPVSYFLTGMEKHSDAYEPSLHGDGTAFFRMLLERMARLPKEALDTAMNELSNHDHSRFLTRTNCTVGRLKTMGASAASEGVSYATFREGVVMQFTLPGAPTIYYGDETGVPGWTDPDNRRPFPWGHEAWDLIGFHKDLIRIRREYSCLRSGSFKPIAADLGFVSYGRFDETSAAVILINHSEKDRPAEIPVWTAGFPEEGKAVRVMQTREADYNVGKKEETVKDGLLRVTLPAWSATIYVKA